MKYFGICHQVWVVNWRQAVKWMKLIIYLIASQQCRSGGVNVMKLAWQNTYSAITVYTAILHSLVTLYMAIDFVV